MSIIGSELLLASAAATGYQVERSLRFNSADSARLTRTPSSASNRNTWTWSAWVKRAALDSLQALFFAGINSSGNGVSYLYFTGSNELNFNGGVNGVSTDYSLITAQLFRDVSAWYHIVAVFNTTSATSTDRVQLYVNGSRVTQFNSPVYPSQNFNGTTNNNVAHYTGSIESASYFNGYLADIYFIDGQALTPSSFGELDTNGEWQPKAYTGSFGTNGYWLKFADNSNNTATTLGKDSSGNGNNWTPNNLSVTAGAGNDSLVDSPTSYGTDTGAGGEVRGNYCTWNPLAPYVGTISNGNLDWTHGSDGCVSATFGLVSGKWYWECVWSTMAGHVGIIKAGYSASRTVGEQLTSGIDWAYAPAGTKWTNNTNTSYGASFTVGDVIGVAFDADNGTLTFYKNNTSQGTAFTGLTSGPYFPSVGSGSAGTKLASINFGQRPFAYTAPSGFKALCDTNLPAPTIAKGNTVMDVRLYTGNGSTQSISGLGFSPDLVWIKERSTTFFHNLFDSVRGALNVISSNAVDQEASRANSLTSFDTSGFSLGNDSTSAGVNRSSQPCVAWTWDAGSSTVTNTAGSITSSVRANTSAGFSIVTYTGNGSSGATVGHGGLVNLANGMIIVKRRNSNVNWFVGHGSQGWTKVFEGLNTTAAISTTSAAWNNTSPTSTVFTLGTETSMNGNGGTFVAYCFAPVAGYSSFGSYTGNGSSDGPFVFCNFRPRWVMIKSSSNAYYWIIYDAARDAYNAASKELFPNDSLAETVVPRDIDFLSNGFKLRNTGTTDNQSGATYIYAAFAENPFQYARAR